MPLFPATSEIDLISRMVAALGTPSKESWPHGFHVVDMMVTRRFPKSEAAQQGGQGLVASLKNGSQDQIELIQQLLLWNQSSRLTAKAALAHPGMRTVPDFYPDFTDSVPGSLTPSDSSGIDTKSGKGNVDPSKLAAMSMGGITQVLKAAKLFKRNAEARRDLRVNKEGRTKRFSFKLMSESDSLRSESVSRREY